MRVRGIDALHLHCVFFFSQFICWLGQSFLFLPDAGQGNLCSVHLENKCMLNRLAWPNHLPIILDKFWHQNRSKAQTAFNSTYFAHIKYKVPYSFAFLYSDLLATSGTWVSLISTKSWLGSDLIAKTQFEIGPTVVKMGSVPFWSSTGQIG